MLILTRKLQEGIIIGNDIKIVIVEIRPSKVRIGIEAPRDITILRNELIDLDQQMVSGGTFHQTPS